MFSSVVSLTKYLDNCPLPPLKESCPTVRVWVWVKIRVSFRIEGQPDNCPEENCPPVIVRVWVRVSFGVGGQFSSGELSQNPFTITKENYNPLLWRKCSLKLDLKKSGFLKDFCYLFVFGFLLTITKNNYDLLWRTKCSLKLDS